MIGRLHKIFYTLYRNGDGFIALAGGSTNWSTAGNYCRSQDGELPLIDNSTSWGDTGSVTIDGFGQYSGHGFLGWPVGLPSAGLWTGAKVSFNSDYSWLVGYDDGNAFVLSASQDFGCNVACVAQ